MKNSDKTPSAFSLIADMPDDQRPREKALSQGIKSLTDAELMAIIFSTGIKGKSVVQMCEEILTDNDRHISRVANMDVREFMQRYKGIGPAKALTMRAALELGARSAADAIKVEDPPITSSSSASRYMKPYLHGLDHEEFWLLLLKRNLRAIKAVRVGQGGISFTAVDVKIVMREAIVTGASAMMLFHNHPSGNRDISQPDIALTRRICDAAKIMDIQVLDHIIFCGDSIYSFHDEGKMP